MASAKQQVDAGQGHSLEIMAECPQAGAAVIHGHDIALAGQHLGQVRGLAAPAGADFQDLLPGFGLQQQGHQLGGLVLKEPEPLLI